MPHVLLVVLRKGFGLDENGPADELVVHLYDLYLDGKVNVPGVGAVGLLADVKSSHVVKKEVDQAQVSNSSHESEPIKANEALQAVAAMVHKVDQFAILKNAANATGRELAEAISAGFHVGAMDSTCPVEGGGQRGLVLSLSRLGRVLGLRARARAGFLLDGRAGRHLDEMRVLKCGLLNRRWVVESATGC